MAWPGHAPAYNGHFEAAKRAQANVAKTIARFEPVVMLVDARDLAQARELCGPGVEARELPIDDGWFRDNGPTFAIDGRGGRIGIHWQFNGWGGRNPVEKDRLAAGRVLAQEGIECVAAPFVLEGGSIHVDGEGTLLTTEECLLNPNRNPTLGRAEIEHNLREYLGVETIIWLKGGPVDDVTDGHVDMVAAFTRPGQVVCLTCEDPRDANYRVLRENREILRGARDARGRRLELIEVPQPPAHAIEQTGKRLGLSHVNFYMANGAIVLPEYGEAPFDERALGIFRELFPRDEVVAVATREILYGGGNIHCITQQEPLAGARA